MMIGEQEMWDAVVRRDRTLDGKFFYGVVTTGVYCRPWCAARLPLRRNVRFFETAEAAARAGLRPCLRCRPLATSGEDPAVVAVARVCDYIRRNSSEPLTLNALAERAGLSPFHFQRSFKAITGISPRQYVEACRTEGLKDALRSRTSVTEAVYEAGYGSGSRVYERSDTRLGMTPGQYRSGGRGVRISYAGADSPLGRMMIGATDCGLCFLEFGEDDRELLERLRAEYPSAAISAMPEPWPDEFEQWMDALRDHLEGGSPRLELPLDVRATAFQMKVWRYLQQIPYGGVESYSEVAAAIGQPKAARAVARACASNRVALVIPCHRVIRGTGQLGGYRWGLDRKRALIDRERAAKAGH